MAKNQPKKTHHKRKDSGEKQAKKVVLGLCVGMALLAIIILIALRLHT